MRMLGSALLAVTLVASSTFGAFADSASPLPPGKPAGVQRAQAADNSTLLWLLGAGIVIGGIALVATQNNDKTPQGNNGTTTTTTTTTTTSSTSTTGTP